MRRLRVDREVLRVSVPAEIVCPDCGGVARRFSHDPEGGFEPGDVAAYRCVDCFDRWDVVVAEDGEA